MFSTAVAAGAALAASAGTSAAQPARSATPQGQTRPGMINAGVDSAGYPVALSFVDYGRGNPVVLIHGWPLCKESWEPQLAELPKHLRVIAYDRRGFGKSSKPWDGYDSDTLADDLKAVLDQLDLQDVTLVGFSMGGCELARYMSRHNGARVGKLVFVSDVTPYLLKTDDNPSGKDKDIFDNMITRVERDRPAYLAEFFRTYYAIGSQSPVIDPVSQLVLDWNMSWALQASCRATTECVTTFSASDYRLDLPKIRVPTLFIHGSADLMVPPESSVDHSVKLVPGAKLKIYTGEPHGLNITAKDQFNRDILAFAGASA
jgi:pimeloyl-ACP methyl ester carboxylesterase